MMLCVDVSTKRAGEKNIITKTFIAFSDRSDIIVGNGFGGYEREPTAAIVRETSQKGSIARVCAQLLFLCIHSGRRRSRRSATVAGYDPGML